MPVSVKLFITKKDILDLQKLGYSSSDINKMKPEEAHKILTSKKPKVEKIVATPLTDPEVADYIKKVAKKKGWRIKESNKQSHVSKKDIERINEINKRKNIPKSEKTVVEVQAEEVVKKKEDKIIKESNNKTLKDFKKQEDLRNQEIKTKQETTRKTAKTKSTPKTKAKASSVDDIFYPMIPTSKEEKIASKMLDEGKNITKGWGLFGGAAFTIVSGIATWHLARAAFNALTGEGKGRPETNMMGNTIDGMFSSPYSPDHPHRSPTNMLKVFKKGEELMYSAAKITSTAFTKIGDTIRSDKIMNIVKKTKIVQKGIPKINPKFLKNYRNTVAKGHITTYGGRNRVSLQDNLVLKNGRYEIKT